MKKYTFALLFLSCLLCNLSVYAGGSQSLYHLSTGDTVFRQDNSIGVQFAEPRMVLSTSIINGGYREDLQGIFNHNSTDVVMTVESYLQSMKQEAKKLGFDPEKVSSMGTGARMDNVVIRTESFQDAVVTAIVTAGVEGNAGRAGDPADYYKPKQNPNIPKPGTINIMLIMNADMPKGTLTRALVTCTEAKTAALQELMVSSRYSNGLATGSGTDQTIVIANPQSKLYLDDTGKHSKLGELIGLAVKSAVKEALIKQNGLTGQKQHNVIRRIERFGVSKDKLYREYLQAGYEPVSQGIFLRKLDIFGGGDQIVTATSLYVHLVDQYGWGLLSAQETAEAGDALIAAVAGQWGIDADGIQEYSRDGFISAWKNMLLMCLHKELSQ
ncbi:MAG: adenosylcobinamide amidohydrolase [Negativicutes bacterium]